MFDILRKSNNLFYKVAGIFFLFLSKSKHIIKGYSTPRTFSIKQYEKCVEYDFGVVDNWLLFLRKYTNNNISVKNKEILELGPGADLGVGLYLLSKGAGRYNAIDVNDLASRVPLQFYDTFFQRLRKLNPSSGIEFLRSQLHLTQNRNNDRLNYICRSDFDISSAFGKETMDMVFSQAAFEHYEDVEDVIKQLSMVVKPGAVMVSEIDLRTHSRWIRDKDPNNIYRYSNEFYKLFRFKGIHNRMRPHTYSEILRKNGWKDIAIIPLETLDEQTLKKARQSLDRKFYDEKNNMDYLSIILCAVKR